ncbi:MAG TPA: hypothetical protein VGO56_21645 [Pyrinomonadaceae bacterium]|jgi:hypothetical protein|nr:hypothetical protein [Pyrinomonadaceae bacterium]
MSTNQNDQARFEAQYRTLLILWGAFLSMFVLYYFLPVAIGSRQQPEDKTLSILFNVMSPLLVAVSFFVKRNVFARAVATQDARLVQTGFIVAAAICEAGALLGLLDYLVAHDRYYFILIGFALLGLVLHFPRRSQLAVTNFKNLSS